MNLCFNAVKYVSVFVITMNGFSNMLSYNQRHVPGKNLRQIRKCLSCCIYQFEKIWNCLDLFTSL